MNSPATTRIASSQKGARLYGWSFALSVATLLLFPCICGFLNEMALPTSTLGVALAWFPFLRYQRVRFFERFIAVFCVFIATIVFAKNVTDLLWFGHHPLLPWGR